MQQIQQHHRIHPTRDSHQNPLPVAEKLFVSDAAFDMACQIIHKPILQEPEGKSQELNEHGQPEFPAAKDGKITGG
jgi:hypothetical protein